MFLDGHVFRPRTPLLVIRMGRKKLSVEEKSQAITLLKEVNSVIRVAAALGVSKMMIYHLKKAATSLPPGTTPPRKAGSRRPCKTSKHTDRILKREVIAVPSVTAVSLKKKASRAAARRHC